MAERFHSVEQAVVAAIRWVNLVATASATTALVFAGILGLFGFWPPAMLALVILSGMILGLSTALDRRIERNLDRVDLTEPDRFDQARAEIEAQRQRLGPSDPRLTPDPAA